MCMRYCSHMFTPRSTSNAQLRRHVVQSPRRHPSRSTAAVALPSFRVTQSACSNWAMDAEPTPVGPSHT